MQSFGGISSTTSGMLLEPDNLDEDSNELINPSAASGGLQNPRIY